MNYCNIKDVVCIATNEYGYSICCRECKIKKCDNRCETIKSDYKNCNHIVKHKKLNENLIFHIEREIKEKLDLIHITNKEIDKLQEKINKLK